MLNLPGDGNITMDTGAVSVIQNDVENEMDTDRGDDSKESEKTDGTLPQKRKRANDGVTITQNAKDGKEDDDSSVETVKV